MEKNNEEERLDLENGGAPSAKPSWNLSGLRFGLGRSIRPPHILVNVFENENEVYVSADTGLLHAAVVLSCQKSQYVYNSAV